MLRLSGAERFLGSTGQQARAAGRPMDVLKQLFKERFGISAERVQPLQGELGASGRKIIRLCAGKTRAIGILYGVREENQAFLAFSRHFLRHVHRIGNDQALKTQIIAEQVGQNMR